MKKPIAHTCCQLLGLPQGSSQEEIERAFRKTLDYCGPTPLTRGGLDVMEALRYLRRFREDYWNSIHRSSKRIRAFREQPSPWPGSCPDIPFKEDKAFPGAPDNQSLASMATNVATEETVSLQELDRAVGDQPESLDLELSETIDHENILGPISDPTTEPQCDALFSCQSADTTVFTDSFVPIEPRPESLETQEVDEPLAFIHHPAPLSEPETQDSPEEPLEQSLEPVEAELAKSDLVEDATPQVPVFSTTSTPPLNPVPINPALFNPWRKPLEITEETVFRGAVLRQIRENQGLSSNDMVDRTKISPTNLANIETDRYKALPATVYLRGFLITIARELRLDPLRVTKSYLEEMAKLKS